MGAFFSSTDNNDDGNAIRFSGVFGHLDKPEPATVWRFNYRDKKYEAKLDQIFEVAEKPTVEIPDEWLEKVKTPVYSGYTSPGYPPAGGLGYLGYPTRGGRGSHKSYPQTGTTGGRSLIVGAEDEEDWAPPVGGYRGQQEKGGSAKKAVSSPQSPVKSIGGGELAYFGATNLPLIGTGFDQTSDFWDFVPAGYGADGISEDHALEVAEKSIASAAVGISTVEPEDASLLATIQNNGRFDEIAINNGIDVAVAFCGISELMADLDGNPSLMKEAVLDMASMMDGPERAKLFRALFDILPKAEQHKVEQFGL
jgi:hypothetical protein